MLCTKVYIISDQVYVEGSIRYSEYNDKDGNLKNKTEIVQSKFMKGD